MLSLSLSLIVLQNSRHPWQAWRDRWIKQLHDKPRPAPAPRQDSPSVHSDQGVKVNTVKKEENVLGESNKQMAMFSPKDVKNLLGHAEDILNILPENLTDAWANWASEVSLFITTNIRMSIKTKYKLITVSQSFCVAMERLLGEDSTTASRQEGGRKNRRGQ